MKYIDEKGSGLSRKQLKKLENIAMASSYEIGQRGGLDFRHCDAEDFPNIHIGSVQRMIERAYKAGLEDGKAGKMI